MGTQRAWDDLIERMQQMVDSGIKRVDLAKRMGVARSYITKMLSGTLTGEKTNASKMMEYMRSVGLDPAQYFDVGPNSDEFDFVSHISTVLGAGHSTEIGYETQKHIAFRKEFLAQVGGSPVNLRTMKVGGDSMEPTVLDGDTLLINVEDTQVKSGAIYAIRIGEEVSVKRLERLPGKIMVKSDNPQHHSFEVDMSVIDGEFAVIGRVRWLGRVL